jgi:hypothetical protein
MTAKILCLLFAAGCSQKTIVAPRDVEIPTTPSSAAAVMIVEPKRPAPIGWPAPESWVLRCDNWFATALVNLRLSPGGAPFATARNVSHALLHLAVADGAPGGAIEVESGGLRLRGLIDPEDIILHPARARVLNGFYVPASGSNLKAVSSSKGAVRVVPPSTPSIHPTTGTLQGELACSDLALDSPSFDTNAVLDGATTVGWADFLPGTWAIAAEEGGTAVAHIDIAQRHPPNVEIIGRGPKSMRIAYAFGDDLDGALVFGWVDASALKVTASGVGTGSGFGRGDGGLINSKKLRRIRCLRDVPVVVEQGDERRTVGSISAGTVIDVMAERSNEIAVEVKTSHIRLTAKAQLIIRESDGGCSAADR